MKTVVAVTFLAIAASAGVVRADDDPSCREVAADARMSLGEVEQKALADGITAREIEVDDGCFEVRGVIGDRRVEATYHPVSGEQLRLQDD